MKESLELGDKIRVRNTFNDYTVTVIRVTKTKAVCKTPHNNEMSFKRNCTGGIRLYTPIKWNTTDYTLIE